MRDYEKEFEGRVEFIRKLMKKSGAAGIVYGNSGGKDSALVGILCKAACNNTVGLIMPCGSKRNYEIDARDAAIVAEHYRIETRTVDLTPVREAEIASLGAVTELTDAAAANIAPRLRRRGKRGPPCRRNGQQERSVHGLLYQVGRRSTRL